MQTFEVLAWEVERGRRRLVMLCYANAFALAS